MSADSMKRAFLSGKYVAACGLFAAAAVLAHLPVFADSRSEIERRERTLRDSAEAANQRTLQQRDIADKQRQLLEYQVRKARRTQQKMQCKLAGGGNAC